MNISELHNIFIEQCNQKVSTDTRKDVTGSLFFAWKGNKLNGNAFVQEAFDKGCLYAVVDDPDYLINDNCILVEDSIKTLQDMARHHRRQFDIPIIGLTGSNGKTTTKELIYAVLSQEKKVLATQGNLNNHTGVPLTLLNIRKETELAIIEMGANHVGEIATLCKIAEPNYGIISNIGRAHIGLFGGLEGIIKGKTELYKFIEIHHGELFVNAQDTLLMKHSKSIVRTLYQDKSLDSYLEVLKNTSPYCSFLYRGKNISTNLTGAYNLDNCACAIIVGEYFGIKTNHIVQAIESYLPENSRSEIVKIDTNIIIKDYYNANTNSMNVAIDNASYLAQTQAKELVLVLGDMFELGEYAYEDHHEVLKRALSTESKAIYLVGEQFSLLSTEIQVPSLLFFHNTKEAIIHFQQESFEDSIILLKASHGMNFDRLFEQFFS